jgi:hypothetical protein
MPWAFAAIYQLLNSSAAQSIVMDPDSARCAVRYVLQWIFVSSWCSVASLFAAADSQVRGSREQEL